MCMECLQTPCHPRCPNAPEPEYPKCALCNGEIHPSGMTGLFMAYPLPDGGYMCDCCANEMDGHEFADAIGYDKVVMQNVD